MNQEKEPFLFHPDFNFSIGICDDARWQSNYVVDTQYKARGWRINLGRVLEGDIPYVIFHEHSHWILSDPHVRKIPNFGMPRDDELFNPISGMDQTDALREEKKVIDWEVSLLEKYDLPIDIQESILKQANWISSELSTKFAVQS